MSLAIGGVLVYLNLRKARFADERRREAELARAHARRRTLESQLQAMQARVEPQFLFNTLAQVKQLYDLNPSLAQGMLDNLIAYLRAAMPHMRDTTSTVAQEIELARAYLDIVKLRLGDQLKVEIEVPDVASDWRMPPMVLLPLIDHAIVHGAGPAGPDRSLRIACESAAEKLRLVIADSGAGFVPEAGGVGITSIRERLAALYSNEATLELCRGVGQATYAMMEIPFEDARHFATADTTEA
jgi:LytS/YehU family sensor histidine kinase